MSEELDDERLSLLSSHVDELRQRVEELQQKPFDLKNRLREAELAGDIGSADQAEIELVDFVGAEQAARFRLEVVENIQKEAQRARYKAESEAAALAEIQRRKWIYQAEARGDFAADNAARREREKLAREKADNEQARKQAETGQNVLPLPEDWYRGLPCR